MAGPDAEISLIAGEYTFDVTKHPGTLISTVLDAFVLYDAE